MLLVWTMQLKGIRGGLFTVPYFPWDFQDFYALIELPPSWFIIESATWGECLDVLGEGCGGGGGGGNFIFLASPLNVP